MNLIKTLRMSALFVCLNAVLLTGAAAQDNGALEYTFETISVPGVDFLSLTASSDYEDYAGYTRNADGKEVGFTLIDGVFKTYDFPGSKKTRFFALGNNGNAAGYYEDSEGRHRGVVLENGELRQYDFPGSIETEIYGISDATGAMTGQFVGEDGVRRGFTGERVVEIPGATATYADFINSHGVLVGSYTDENGIFHLYIEYMGEWSSYPIQNAEQFEYAFVHGVTDLFTAIFRAKKLGDVPRTFVGQIAPESELRVPGAVVTEGWNINQDHSVVGYYETADGKRHGFAANPVDELDYVYETIEVPGVDFLAVAASSDFQDYAGFTRNADGKEVAFTLIDGVFEMYDFPGSQKMHFYALGNNGNAAGYYVDSEGKHRGVVLENGDLRPYDFPGSVETEIWGISDTTGGLTGNFVGADGVRRGFTHDEIVEVPGAVATYADFVSPEGVMVGSYIDADGVYHPYRSDLNDGNIVTFDLQAAESFEYYFVHGAADLAPHLRQSQMHLMRSKKIGDVPRTHVGDVFGKRQELQFPGSVWTQGYNINADLSVVGYYEAADGSLHSFVARLVREAPEPPPDDDNYTFEPIHVPGVDFLSVTASSDFEDYAGYTRNAIGKEIAFTLIDGVFTTYDFPGSQKTHFYALGNNGTAAGHYMDSGGLYHGVVLENGELRQYDFPNSVQTEIYGISDSTGAMTGNFVGEDGVRRGFSGDTIVEFPGAAETYADFVSGLGNVVGSYVDADGGYNAYLRGPGGSFATLDIPAVSNLEYFYLHGINDALVAVGRAKAVGDVPRTYVGNPLNLKELRVPYSVTEGWNINQDGSVVGHYDSDGRRLGFIARPKEASPPGVPHPKLTYRFETIEVPGVDFLAVTASSDFEDYAGNTPGPDGKMVGFTLIDGVFTTYDFPGSQGVYFYALGNDGKAAGHYLDSDGLYHGVILENGELRQYDFPGAVQTEIYGLSDSTGALTGNFIDASGVRRGFSGDAIVEAPGASATYADFVSWTGHIVGSYVDADGVYHAYMRSSLGRFLSIDLPNAANLEYFFLHGLNNARFVVGRAKAVGDVPRTYVGSPLNLKELHVPDSVSTEGWNINQDGSVVGHYDSADGRRHGFIARPVPADPEPEPPSIEGYYTFESIDVPGIDFLEVAASNDFGGVAGNTRIPGSRKTVGFTLIDGVFKTYDFPGSQRIYFYALGNDGRAAGHYRDSDGIYHGVVLENGELRQYDFPGAVETHIYGISDATGAFSGNIVDEAGVSRAFSGDLVISVPGAINTYGDFVNAEGAVVGSYIDADGMFHGFIRDPDGSFTNIDLPEMQNLQYLFVNTITDAGVVGFRAKAANDILRSYILLPNGSLHEIRFPGSVITAVRNVNQDGSIVGFYDTPDGRRHGFFGRPVNKELSDLFGNAYTVALAKGLNMITVPLKPPAPMNAKALAGLAGSTTVIKLDEAKQRFVGWTPGATNDGFAIEGGKGYIVNVPTARHFAFAGAPWTDPADTAQGAPPLSTDNIQSAWAFVVSGRLEGKRALDGYHVVVRNRRTNETFSAPVQDGYFAAATADLSRQSVVEAGDAMELRVVGPDGNIESQTFRFDVTSEHLANAVLPVRLYGVGKPSQNRLLQNYPNPFNPETWIPYQLAEDSDVTIQIYDASGRLIRSLALGYQPAGFYNSRGRAAYWDGRNAVGELVASGVYFYHLKTPAFRQTRRLLILK